MPMVGVDTPLVLCYRDEYKALGAARGDFVVHTVHEWLATFPESTWQGGDVPSDGPVMALFAHCTEKTALPKTEQIWQDLFARVGQKTDIVKVGCCGMNLEALAQALAMSERKAG